MNYVVAAIGDWNKDLFKKNSKKNSCNWYFTSDPKSFNATIESIDNIKYIFFIHWRWKIPSTIFEKYDCIGFHMTDLPFGRGGSPLQNLIVRGFEETVISAFKIISEMDGGPIYFKEKLSIKGKAKDIYLRASKITWKMIGKIVLANNTPVEQQGKVVEFVRRTPIQSKLPDKKSLKSLYDHIRMLDAPGYPHAYCDIDGIRLIFQNAKLKNGILTASVMFNLDGKQDD